MGKMGQPDRKDSALVHKMFELESAYRQITEQDRELVRYRRMSKDGRTEQELDNEQDREVMKLRYMVSKLEERLQVAKVVTENATRELKNELESRKILDKKLKSQEKEIKDMRAKISSLRSKLGVSTANYNVGRHETDDLRKNIQDSQIQIARLEERLVAANVERERIKNPQNPDGSEEVKKRIDTNRKEYKKLKIKIEQLEGLREVDQLIIGDKEEEIRLMTSELNKCRMTTLNLENNLEVSEMNVQTERDSREQFEDQYQVLRKEKETFDAQIKQFKVKLGINQATTNVNVRHAELLRRKDEEYKNTVQTLEKKLRMANVEIERLTPRTMLLGKTAESLQDHKGRLKKHRNNFGMDFNTPRLYDTPGVTGWSTNRSTPKGDRVSLNSVASVGSQTKPHVLPKIRTNSGKRGRGRISAP